MAKKEELIKKFKTGATVNEILETLQKLKENGQITGKEKFTKEYEGDYTWSCSLSIITDDDDRKRIEI